MPELAQLRHDHALVHGVVLGDQHAAARVDRGRSTTRGVDDAAATSHGRVVAERRPPGRRAARRGARASQARAAVTPSASRSRACRCSPTVVSSTMGSRARDGLGADQPDEVEPAQTPASPGRRSPRRTALPFRAASRSASNARDRVRRGASPPARTTRAARRATPAAARGRRRTARASPTGSRHRRRDVTPRPGRRRRAAITVNVLPSPTWLRTVISPPMRRTSRRQIARPSPVPPKRRVVDVSAWREGLEQPRQASSGDADPRVASRRTARGSCRRDCRRRRPSAPPRPAR